MSNFNWDWEDNHVYDSFEDGSAPVTSQEGFTVQDIVEAGSTLICAGPAQLDDANVSSTVGFELIPIGLIEQAQVSQQKQLQHIFEIGSKVSYIMPGRTTGNISLSRVFFDGDSLMRALYRGEVDTSIPDSYDENTGVRTTYFKSQNGKAVQSQAIGSGKFAINLASSFFDQPVGLCMIFQDHHRDAISQVYFEGCRIGTHQFGIHSQQNILQESVTLSFTKIKPVILADTINLVGGQEDKRASDTKFAAITAQGNSVSSVTQ